MYVNVYSYTGVCNSFVGMKINVTERRQHRLFRIVPSPSTVFDREGGFILSLVGAVVGENHSRRR